MLMSGLSSVLSNENVSLSPVSLTCLPTTTTLTSTSSSSCPSSRFPEACFFGFDTVNFHFPCLHTNIQHTHFRTFPPTSPHNMSLSFFTSFQGTSVDKERRASFCFVVQEFFPLSFFYWFLAVSRLYFSFALLSLSPVIFHFLSCDDDNNIIICSAHCFALFGLYDEITYMGHGQVDCMSTTFWCFWWNAIQTAPGKREQNTNTQGKHPRGTQREAHNPKQCWKRWHSLCVLYLVILSREFFSSGLLLLLVPVTLVL